MDDIDKARNERLRQLEEADMRREAWDEERRIATEREERTWE